jgi:hypothetical protein
VASGVESLGTGEQLEFRFIRRRLPLCCQSYLLSFSRAINLSNQVIKKLAIISGISLTDPAIMRIRNGHTLLEAAQSSPKPKKLIVRNAEQEDELIITGQTTGRRGASVRPKLAISLLNLPNVKVSDKRISRVDQEKQIGRWKVIQEELEARSLPLSPVGFKYSV